MPRVAAANDDAVAPEQAETMQYIDKRIVAEPTCRAMASRRVQRQMR
jgi:hypothetical protein